MRLENSPGADIVAGSRLSRLEWQVVFLTTSVENRCPECVRAHSALARSAGLSRSAVTAVRQGRRVEDPRLESLRSTTVAVARQRARLAPDQIHAFLSHGYSRRDLLAVMSGVAHKTVTNSLEDTETRNLCRDHVAHAR